MISRLLKKAHASVTEMYKEAKQNFYQQKITKNVINQKVLIKVVNDLLYRENDTSLPSPDSNEELVIKLLT